MSQLYHQYPFSGLLQSEEDGWGCEEVCTMQLLYMHGALQPEDFETFSARIGRKFGEDDQQRACLREIFLAGFYVWDFSTVDLDRIASTEGFAYVTQLWREDGCSEETIGAHLPRAFPSIQSRAVQKIKLIQQFADHYRHTSHPATAHDLREVVAGGWMVGCDYLLDDGSCHYVLVLRAEENNRYLLFDPQTGLRSVSADKFFQRIMPSIECFSM